MTSFGYRSNPRYAIKECSSCGTLYTRNCACSIGTVEDKILVPKPPKNYARCTRCGYLVDGPHCQGCALLCQEFEEILDNGSFVDEIIFDLNRAPDSPNQFHCFHCKDVLRDGEACKRCTCEKCGSGLSKGLCYICGHNQKSLNDSPIISETSSQSPPNSTIVAMSVQEEKRIEEEQAAKAQSWKFPVCYDDDDDEEGYNSLNDNIISELPPYSAVTPTEPIDSLSMGDGHLNTIPATESDEFIKSCVENLVPNPSESEGEKGCDVPAGFTTFSNVLFDDDYNSDSTYRPPTKPPDGNTETLNIKMLGDVSDQK
nr:hypothetical protein [Tanacetum cinerariifolium]